MRKTGMMAKLHSADAGDAVNDANAKIAKYGALLPLVIDTLDGLELLCRSETPAKDIREAMTDRPMKYPKGVGRDKRKLIHRLRKIRASLITLLVAIDERDAKFFGDMAGFCRSEGANSSDVAVDPLRLRLTDLQFWQELGARKPLTKGQLQDALKCDRRTLSRAANEVGLKTQPDKKGRPSKKAGN